MLTFKNHITMEKNETMKERATVEGLFCEITELIRNNFVATYQRMENILTMRLPNGQKFSVSIQEIL